METVNVTDNATFARVKLGDIRPNRFRNLDRWPLEQEVLDKLKQSIGETGFWSNLQAIENERGEIELRFGHHRLAAGLELFGPEYEVAIEIVPYRGEWNLQRALLMENSIGRNKIMHTHEIVHQLMHWWDDGVFDLFPTYGKARIACKNSILPKDAPKIRRNFMELVEFERYFSNEGRYEESVKYGIGREVIEKMLGGAEKKTDIIEALAALEPTARRKRGLELRAAEERAKAEAERAEAEELRREAQRIHEELERGRKEAETAAAARQAEMDRIEQEKRAAEEQAKHERNEANRKAAEEKRKAADARMVVLKKEQEAKKQAAAELHERALREHKERQKVVAEKESKARQAGIRADQKEQALERREWYDARASEVFGSVPGHAAEFRRSVSQDAVRPCLDTENLVPFAKAIKEKYGEKLTSECVRREVNENFQEFKKTLQLKEKKIREEIENDNPALKLIRLMDQAVTDLNRVSSTLFEIEQVMKTNQFTSLQGPRVGAFKDALDKVAKRINFYS